MDRETHWRPATRLGLQAIITQRKRSDFRVFDSDQYASPHVCTLEAMRTQERFSMNASSHTARRHKPAVEPG